MIGYDALKKQVEAEAKEAQEGLLQEPCRSRLFEPQDPQEARGIVFGLHGFTAGPWQLNALAQRLAQQGYYVYTARLPGHGVRYLHGLPTHVQLPGAMEWQAYSHCANWLAEQAQYWSNKSQLPLIILGFSLGGALALEMARICRHSLQRLLLVAPLLRLQGAWPRYIYQICTQLEEREMSSYLDLLPFGWGLKEPAPAKHGWVRPGHWRFSVGNIYAASRYAEMIAAQSEQTPVLTQLILTEADDRCDLEAAKELISFERKDGLWIFPKALKVPHAMLSFYENTDLASYEQAMQVAQKFLIEGRVSNRHEI